MSTLKCDTVTNNAGTKSLTVSNIVDGSAKAWVNFNGTGTVAIRASFNVTSITDNGVGDYTANFTTAMPDVNYAVNITSGFNSLNFGVVSSHRLDVSSVSGVRINTGYINVSGVNTAQDNLYNSICVFR